MLLSTFITTNIIVLKKKKIRETVHKRMINLNVICLQHLGGIEKLRSDIFLCYTQADACSDNVALAPDVFLG